MSVDAILYLLSTDTPLSGEALCQRLGMTRAAVWKRIQKLRQAGYRIEGMGKRGYLLVAPEDLLLPFYIQRDLKTKRLGRFDILYERVMASTNDTLKALLPQAPQSGTLCLCERQTHGKGRMQRTWEAAEGENLLQSVLLRPKLTPEQGQLCTLAAAVALAEAIEEQTGQPARIKWPNDIVVGTRKVAGILTEMAVNMDSVEHAIIGAGVNVNQRSFPKALEDKATSLALLTGASVDRRALLCLYLLRLEEAMERVEADGLAGIREEYEARSVTLGKRVKVQSGLLGQTVDMIGIATGLSDTGALLVTDENGMEHPVLSADVSVRGVMGYVDV